MPMPKQEASAVAQEKTDPLEPEILITRRRAKRTNLQPNTVNDDKVRARGDEEPKAERTQVRSKAGSHIGRPLGLLNKDKVWLVRDEPRNKVSHAG
jgi:hypothetical protein